MNDLTLGLLLGGLLSIPIGLAVNLLTPKLSQMLEAGSVRLKGRNRNKAIIAYWRRKGLFENALKRESHFLGLQTIIILLAIAMGFIINAFSGMLPMGDFKRFAAQATFTDLANYWTLFLAFLLIGALMVFSLQMLGDDMRVVTNFEEYEQKVVERFGADVIDVANRPPPEPLKLKV